MKGAQALACHDGQDSQVRWGAISALANNPRNSGPGGAEDLIPAMKAVDRPVCRRTHALRSATWWLIGH